MPATKVSHTVTIILTILTIIVLTAVGWMWYEAAERNRNADNGETAQETQDLQERTSLLGETVIVYEPKEDELVSSPLSVSGEVTGGWFFEGDFPIRLVNADGEVIAESFVTAEGEWMSEAMVAFSGTIEFDEQPDGTTGTLVLMKDNPSDDPELDDAVEIPIRF